MAAVVVARNDPHAVSAQPSIKDAANRRLTAGIIGAVATWQYFFEGRE
jgi:hypothetical protein